MGIEIERKFLLKNNDWRSLSIQQHVIKQGYLQSGLEATQRSSVRIRTSNQHANINIKSVDLSMVRQEFEYDIPLADAQQMLETLCDSSIISKTRYDVPYASHVWEVDIFEGENAGLQVAEVELGSLDEAFEKPPWIGEEVSDDERYYNICLLKYPYRMWSK
ncbi:MAG TPA: CYTH domain-containing protein [Gammaproteobacteria bacterium]|nr:CYTH domain-containing protein [Gammaproteobacteria bacterium]